VKEFKRFGKRLDFAQVTALELRIVKIVQVVKRPDVMAIVEQALADMRAVTRKFMGLR
jgi:hypothetical protein